MVARLPVGGRLIGRWEMIVSDPAGPVEAQEPRPRDGTVFAGRYRIMGFLGEGDRKHTYLAEDTLLGRKVALALIKPAAATADPVGTGREVKALVQAGNHDNIVTLFDRGNAEDTDYLVFYYLAGGTLRDYLAKRADRGRALSADEVMQLGRQLARALSQVHGHGLVHRDVAPANVWLDERRVAHLGDFDSAVSSRDASGPVLQPVTTQGYAAPEQVAGGNVDQRSDLYSLGAVLFEALTGERPVPGCQEPARTLAALRPGSRATWSPSSADS